jgi:penicillin-binding protein 1A
VAAALASAVALAGVEGGATRLALLLGAPKLAGARLALPPLAQRSVVYAADGAVLAVLHGPTSNRAPVPLDQVPKPLVDAVVDTEDANFWHHGGVDVRGVIRAAKADLSAGSARQGGSTITQQLVKNSLLTPTRDLRRKLAEVALAGQVERRLGKRGVLERYMNTVYLGEGAYGVEAAAETYFARPVEQLGAPEAALLAGLIRNPVGADPLRDPGAARARRATVLDAMVAHGHLAAADAQRADGAPLPASASHPPDAQDWFTDAVRQELLAAPRLGATVPERARALAQGGLRIQTTVDPRLQQAAEAAVRGGLPAGYHLSAALAAVDPATGEVRALVGGPDRGGSQYNAAVAEPGRQPGSSFKVFTLVAALERGSLPSDVVDGSTPCAIPNPGGTPNPWKPDNFEGEDFGPLSLADATAHSVNCAYARLALSVGLARIGAIAQVMGITNPLPVVPTMTLGTADVTPLQMASSYATLAADGVHRVPHLVRAVDRADGTPVLRADPQPRQVVPTQVARQATAVLGGVIATGTGKAAAVPGRAVVGKTGTAEDYQDAWFVGYAPQLSAAVWMGDPSADRPMRGLGGVDVVGGTFPARIWSVFMTSALSPLPPATFPAPDGAVNAGPSPAAAHTRVTTWCSASCGQPPG